MRMPDEDEFFISGLLNLLQAMCQIFGAARRAFW
jgi:hypothetical protein